VTWTDGRVPHLGQAEKRLRCGVNWERREGLGQVLERVGFTGVCQKTQNKEGNLNRERGNRVLTKGDRYLKIGFSTRKAP